MNKSKYLIKHMKAYKKVISKLYLSLQQLHKENTFRVKPRWESEGNLTMAQEEWEEIFRQQWKTTSSSSGRELSWKNVMSYFCTSAQKDLSQTRRTKKEITFISFGGASLSLLFGLLFMAFLKPFL